MQPAIRSVSPLHGMYYAVQAFFSNGGSNCYIVSTGALRQQEGFALAEFEIGLAAIEKVEEITLIVFPEAQKLTSEDCFKLYKQALQQCATAMNRFCLFDIYGADQKVHNLTDATALVNSFRQGIGADNLKFGAAYFPNLYTIIPVVYDDSLVTIIHEKNGGAGEFNGQSLASILVSHPDEYNKLKATANGVTVMLPPAAFAAAAICATDNSRGVWKAPANVALNAVSGTSFNIIDGFQTSLNIDVQEGKSINSIRQFANKGILIWGARTLAGNDNEWHYISVRRFCSMVQAACTKALQPFLFELNDANTWAKAEMMIGNFLTAIWRQGGLQGTKPEHAFYVHCGLNKTMTAQDQADGKLVVEIGMAVVRPAEFIILRIQLRMH